jgi:hypothetical protein
VAPLSVPLHLRGFCSFANERLQEALEGVIYKKSPGKKIRRGAFPPRAADPDTLCRVARYSTFPCVCESKILLLTPLYYRIPYACAQLYANLAKNSVQPAPLLEIVCLQFWLKMANPAIFRVSALFLRIKESLFAYLSGN